MRSKVMRVCLCIALCLCLFTGTFAVMGWGDALRQVGGAVLYPFRWLADKVTDAADGFFSYFQDIEELESENDALREEIESLRAGLLDAEIIADENAWLYRYLAMKEEWSETSLCEARVVGYEYAAGSDGQSYAVLLTLNKGSSSGIQEGMPVVTPSGLVGMVSEVGLTSSTVRTILHTEFAAGAADSRSAEIGLWEGSFSFLPNGQAVVTGFSAEANVAVGDVILTSGTGRVYPYGLPLGRVVSVQANAYSRTLEAVVTPFVDTTDLREVMVMTDVVGRTDANIQAEDGS